MGTRIMAVTTGRADYGLLCPLLRLLDKSQAFELLLIATGSHLSERHGKTISFIEEDGFRIAGTVEMAAQDDTEDGICRAISGGMAGFSNLYSKMRIDLIIILGDRFELWPVCMAAVIYKIPIAHIHGGESTLGAIDDYIRHSITKMSSLHFASIEQYANRIIQMGEQSERVFCVGAIGLDNIKGVNIVDRDSLSDSLGVNLNKKIAILTYHPVTMNRYDDAEREIETVLSALIETGLTIIMTMPNADAGGGRIYSVLQRYALMMPDRFKLFKALGQRNYLSAMRYAAMMIGNSSSGIIEAASFRLPVVNIGDRQAGRFKPDNVIDCLCEKGSILQAIERAESDQFTQSISELKNPYGDGNTANNIVKILESVKLEGLLRKGFYDLKV